MKILLRFINPINNNKMIIPDGRNIIGRILCKYKFINIVSKFLKGRDRGQRI